VGFPTVTVEAGFTAAASGTVWILGDAVRGKLDTATLAGEIWTDISTYVRSLDIRRGVSRAEGPILRYEAGTCSIELDNSDRRFDPTNLSGPYVAAGVTQVTPMRAVRVSAMWAGQNYALFRGFADSWSVSWSGPAFSLCDLQATDATKVLSNFDRVALGSPVGAGEDSGARVHRVLDSASWPTYDRVVSTGDSTLQGTTMDRSAWEELLAVQDSEIGEMYVDGAGRVVFRNRQASMEDPRSALPQAAFGDGAGELPFLDTGISYDDTTIANLVRVARTGGTQQTATDLTSVQTYLTHTHDRTDLQLETDATVADYAAFVLYQSKDPELRFTSLAVNPHDDEPALFPQVLGRAFGDRISITRRPPGGGTVTRSVFIRGVQHTIEATGEWTTTWALQSATRWNFLTLDSLTTGALDANALAY
jgi:hypothetical protein